MARKTAPQASFDDQLVLFRYFLHELKIDSLGALSVKLNSAEYGVSTKVAAPISAITLPASAR